MNDLGEPVMRPFLQDVVQFVLVDERWLDMVPYLGSGWTLARGAGR